MDYPQPYLECLAIGTALAFSSITIAGAKVSPDKKSCAKTTACITYTNSSTGAGVQGVSNGFSPSTYQVGAIQGNAGGVNGAYAYASGRNGGFFENGTSSYYALFGYSDVSGGFPLGAQNAVDGGSFYVDSVGDGFFSGSVFSSLRTRDGHRVGMFAAQNQRGPRSKTSAADTSWQDTARSSSPPISRVLSTRARGTRYSSPQAVTIAGCTSLPRVRPDSRYAKPKADVPASRSTIASSHTPQVPARLGYPRCVAHLRIVQPSDTSHSKAVSLEPRRRVR